MVKDKEKEKEKDKEKEKEKEKEKGFRASRAKHFERQQSAHLPKIPEEAVYEPTTPPQTFRNPKTHSQALNPQPLDPEPEILSFLTLKSQDLLES